jgi:hypothetical protein
VACQNNREEAGCSHLHHTAEFPLCRNSWVNACSWKQFLMIKEYTA